MEAPLHPANRHLLRAWYKWCFGVWKHNRIVRRIKEWIPAPARAAAIRCEEKLRARFCGANSPCIPVGKFRMKLDVLDTLRLSFYGEYEPLTTLAMRSLIGQGHTAIDIGAHIGYYTLLMADAVGSGGKVIAFEPEPGNYAILQENVRNNGYCNVQLVQKAVADRTGISTLHISTAANSGTHSLLPLEKGEKASIPVSQTSLDEELKEFAEPIDCIKMDIQGAEPLAFRGMKDLIRRNPAMSIILEFDPNFLTKNGEDPHRFLQEIREAGFVIHCIDEDREQQWAEPESLRVLAETHPPEIEAYWNLVCTPKSLRWNLPRDSAS